MFAPGQRSVSLVAGGGSCVFTQTGPFRWNGILAFWLLAVSFFIWMVTMGTYVIKASRIPDALGVC